ncbi:hypothetical protein ES703_124140 [subsurface metagenome]
MEKPPFIEGLFVLLWISEITPEVQRAFRHHFSCFPNPNFLILIVDNLYLHFRLHEHGETDGVHLGLFGTIPAIANHGALGHTKVVHHVNTELRKAPFNQLWVYLLTTNTNYAERAQIVVLSLLICLHPVCNLHRYEHSMGHPIPFNQLEMFLWSGRSG